MEQTRHRFKGTNCRHIAAVGNKFAKREIQGKKRGPQDELGPFIVLKVKTSRGEQLLRVALGGKPPQMHQLRAVCWFFGQRAII
jgi:hypothetical protein